MNKLTELLESYNEAFAVANKDLSDVPHKTRPGREMLKVEMAEKAKTLANEYNKELENTFVLVLTQGPAQKEYATIANAESGAIVIDSSVPYNYIMNRVKENMTNVFSSHQFGTMLSALRQVCSDLDVTDFSLQNLESDINVENDAELYKLVRQMVEKNNGTRILKEFIRKGAFKKALEDKISTKVNPLIVLNVPADIQEKLMAETFIGGRGLCVDTNVDNVGQEFVLETFEQIRNILKGK